MNKRESQLCQRTHSFSSNNKFLLETSGVSGCFYCCNIFPTIEIENWINDKENYTALCPFCGIDSVLPKNEDYPLTTEFLNLMYEYWFT